MKPASMRFALAAGFGLICLASGAEAQTQAAQVSDLPLTSVSSPRMHSLRVSYADLDVSSEAGMRTLENRMRVAVHRVCWQSNHPRDLDEVYECRNQSRRDAWRQFERNQEMARTSGDSMVAAIAVGPVAH